MTFEPKSAAARMLEELQLQSTERLFSVVDGAQDLGLAYEAKCLYGQEVSSLFVGEMAVATSNVAPYLVPIDPASGYLERWVGRSGSNAGILLTTTADSAILHAHLRSIFIVQDEHGQDYFFRFYDPRVLRAYLPTCRVEEIVEFFGPLKCIACELESPHQCVVYSHRSGSLDSRIFHLNSLKSDASA